MGIYVLVVKKLDLSIQHDLRFWLFKLYLAKFFLW